MGASQANNEPQQRDQEHSRGPVLQINEHVADPRDRENNHGRRLGDDSGMPRVLSGVGIPTSSHYRVPGWSRNRDDPVSKNGRLAGWAEDDDLTGPKVRRSDGLGDDGPARAERRFHASGQDRADGEVENENSQRAGHHGQGEGRHKCQHQGSPDHSCELNGNGVRMRAPYKHWLGETTDTVRVLHRRPLSN
jgi:hypothetical protein